MRRSLQIPTVLVALVALAAACSSSTEPSGVRLLGVVAGYGADDPHVGVPATAERGRPVVVEVRTYTGGCSRTGETEARVSGLTAEVVPYDYQRVKGTACTRELVWHTHRATLRFDLAGTARVRVRGGNMPSPDSPGPPELVVERELVVR